MCKWTLCLALLIGLFLEALGTVIISELTGGDTAQIGSNNTLICSFVLKDETGVEVKWFYNDNKQIVSWIPTRTRPQAIGAFKSILDFADVAENETTRSVVRFRDLNFNLTGRYTCKVSGDVDEKSETLNMIVYQPASSVEFVEDDGNVTCSAYDVYPEPTISITISYTTGRDDPVPTLEILGTEEKTDDNFYNVTKTLVLDKSLLNQTVHFTCNVFIPGTVFNETLTVTIEVERYESTTDYPDTTTDPTTFAPVTTSTTIKTSTLKPTTGQGDSGVEAGTSPVHLLFYLAVLLGLQL
ncbi:hypothetical protein PPYR_14595 [Photinus pyralis]|uniref:Ig-like domain-containing protein n=1 Tax=Photinus pyralis TaxID=7054 RepID=A0A5N4A5M2_PHOPY|nr:uncharacterized protein LOC116180640 isoform X1 [Photinus pyralis]KAB0792636.1 hypothetical protein PPYR_14595 [Photinus pyralis]